MAAMASETQSPALKQSPVKNQWFASSSSQVVPLIEVVDGNAEVAIPDEILADAQPLWRAFMVGHFIGDVPHVWKIHAAVNRLWVTPEKSSRIDVQILNSTTALFRVDNEAIRSRFLKRRYWHIAEVRSYVSEILRLLRRNLI